MLPRGVARWLGRSALTREPSFRAIAPAVSGFQDFAFLRGGTMAAALRAAPLVHVNMYCQAVDGIMAIARVEGAVRCLAAVCLQTVRGGSDAGNLLIRRELIEQLGQHATPVRRTGGAYRLDVAHIAGGELTARISSVFSSIRPLSECTIRLPGNGC